MKLVVSKKEAWRQCRALNGDCSCEKKGEDVCDSLIFQVIYGDEEMERIRMELNRQNLTSYMPPHKVDRDMIELVD